MLLLEPTRYRVFLILLLILFASGTLEGQGSSVHGEVTDSVTGDPLPYVHVTFPKSSEGTVTDEGGRYRLSSSVPQDSVRFSYLGYRDQGVPIERGKEQRIDVRLAPKEMMLQGVEIRPEDKENPAHPIMRKVIAKKEDNAPGSVPYYEYDVYNKLNVGMGVRDKVVNSWILKPFRFVFENIDSSGREPYLPIFVSESRSRVYYRDDPRSKKEYIQATHTSGIENPSVTKYMGNMYQELDLYSNDVHIFDKSFKSPIADGGFAFYNYYLIDSNRTIDGHSCYQIRYMPRRKNELTFEGDLYIHKGSFALKRFEGSISEGANINYIREMQVEQEFGRFEGKYWMLTGNEVDVEAAVLVPHNLRWQKFFAHKTTHYEDLVFDEPRPDSVYQSTDDIGIQKMGPGDRDSTEKGPEYWKGRRPVPLTGNEKAVYEITDSIKKMPHYKVARSLLRGFVEVGPIELGPFFTTYSFNEIEGNRFRLGMRTDQLFGERANFNAYGAYGTLDERYKYGANFKYFFERSPTWHYAGFAFRKDLQQLGQGQRYLENDNILNSAFRRRPIDRLNGIEEYRAFYSKEWRVGLSTRLEGRKRTISPRGTLEFFEPTHNGGEENVNGISSTELSLSTHFGYKEKFYTTSYRRVSLGSTHPVVDLNYTYGFEDLLGSDYGFQRLEGSYSHRVRLGYFGTLEYGMRAGKIWGSLPYPLLELHDGNETYFLNDDAFNLMNYYEFVSDEWMSLSVTHHFEGLFFDRIPFLSKLNLREVVSGKALIGSFSEKNREEMLLPAGLRTLDAEGDPLKKPYAEATVGVENILSFIRIDGVWRLNYLDHPNITPFGIRAKVEFGF